MQTSVAGHQKQFEIALEQGTRSPRFQGILSLFWGLIFAKLFLLEYAMQIYEVPFDSTFYIWTLTLSMGVVCSIAFMRLDRHHLPGKPLTGKLVRSIWLGVFSAMVIGSAGGVLVAELSPYLLPGVYALILGVGFFSHSVLNGRTLFRFLALAWWAAALLLLSRNEVVTFAWFSGFLLAFHVLPTAWLHFLPGSKKQVAASNYSI